METEKEIVETFDARKVIDMSKCYLCGEEYETGTECFVVDDVSVLVLNSNHTSQEDLDKMLENSGLNAFKKAVICSECLVFQPIEEELEDTQVLEDETPSMFEPTLKTDEAGFEVEDKDG